MIARRLTAAAWALGAVLALAGAPTTPPPARAAPRPRPCPSRSATSSRRPSPVQLTAVGNAQAYTTVGIKSQINGQLVEVRFKEGQDVRKDDLLFVIDQRPVRGGATPGRGGAEPAPGRGAPGAGRRRARHGPARERAGAGAALPRAGGQGADRARAIRPAQHEHEPRWRRRWKPTARRSRTRARRSRRRRPTSTTPGCSSAYTTLRSPIDGRTGNLLVQNGNILKANDEGPIVVINQIHPIYVSFAVPEQHLADIKKSTAPPARSRCVARLPRQQETLATGELTFVNNTVDQTTGTIQLKATFANQDNVLWPGQFLDVSLLITSRTASSCPRRRSSRASRAPTSSS